MPRPFLGYSGSYEEALLLHNLRPARAPRSELPAPSARGEEEEEEEEVMQDRPWRTTPIGGIFKNCPAKWSHIHAGDAFVQSKTDNGLLGFILMACLAEQTLF